MAKRQEEAKGQITRWHVVSRGLHIGHANDGNKVKIIQGWHTVTEAGPFSNRTMKSHWDWRIISAEGVTWSHGRSETWRSARQDAQRSIFEWHE